MSNNRKNWEILIDITKELGMPTPILQPTRLGDKSMISIGMFFSASGTVEEACKCCFDFCQGYKYRMSQDDSPKSPTVANGISSYGDIIMGKIPMYKPNRRD